MTNVDSSLDGHLVVSIKNCIEIEMSILWLSFLKCLNALALFKAAGCGKFF